MSLYPAIEPFQHETIQVSDLHTVYFEQCGNPEGQPILFIHGGPGGGCDASYRQYFDPKHYHIILVDQRGCGRSSPIAELRENNTENLISDFEVIREKLNIDKWILFGGSWGSTLSLCYAQAHPERAQGLILRGIFLGRATEDDWIYSGTGGADIFPDAWEPFRDFIPENERDNMIGAYYKRITGDDKAIAQKAADLWAAYETKICKLRPLESDLDYIGTPASLAIGAIECHYFHHQLFLEPNQILNNMDKIRHIPGAIVHGRYDVVCKLETAWALHKEWPEAEFHIIPDAGHAGSEPGISKKLVELTDKFRGVA